MLHHCFVFWHVLKREKKKKRQRYQPFPYGNQNIKRETGFILGVFVLRWMCMPFVYQVCTKHLWRSHWRQILNQNVHRRRMMETAPAPPGRERWPRANSVHLRSSDRSPSHRTSHLQLAYFYCTSVALAIPSASSIPTFYIHGLKCRAKWGGVSIKYKPWRAEGGNKVPKSNINE